MLLTVISNIGNSKPEVYFDRCICFLLDNQTGVHLMNFHQQKLGEMFPLKFILVQEN